MSILLQQPGHPQASHPANNLQQHDVITAPTVCAGSAEEEWQSAHSLLSRSVSQRDAADSLSDVALGPGL